MTDPVHPPAAPGRPRTRVRNAREAAGMLRDGTEWPTMAEDLRRMVPRWHFEMLADSARNRALLDAIAAVVKPRHLVLDLGTGEIGRASCRVRV